MSSAILIRISLWFSGLWNRREKCVGSYGVHHQSRLGNSTRPNLLVAQKIAIAHTMMVSTSQSHAFIPGNAPFMNYNCLSRLKKNSIYVWDGAKFVLDYFWHVYSVEPGDFTLQVSDDAQLVSVVPLQDWPSLLPVPATGMPLQMQFSLMSCIIVPQPFGSDCASISPIVFHETGSEMPTCPWQ